MKIVADDYGLSPQVDQAILTLVQKGLVHSVSVMALTHPDVARLTGNIDVGFHVDLTSARANFSTSPRRLLCDGILGRLIVNDLVHRIQDQLKILQDRGFVVRRLDTHQHIHLVPQVLNALIAVAREQAIYRIRCLTMSARHLPFYFGALLRCGFVRQSIKMKLLYAGGRWMKYKLDRAGIDYCPNLVLMPLASEGDYARLLALLMRHFAQEDAELVVHPGMPGMNLLHEPYIAGREMEYRALLTVENFLLCGTAFTNV